MEVNIEILKGPEKGRRLKFIKPANLLIGRSKDAEIKLNPSDRYVARKQCILEIVPPKCVLHHVSKSNETIVNDKPVIETDLSNNDIITVGFTSLRVNIISSIETKKIHCKECKRKIEVPENAEDNFLCDNCSDKINKKVAPSKKTKFICESCKKDLTSNINIKLLTSDEIHICPDCLPEGEYLKGDKIGKYELIKFLNQGGMGAVYIVYHKETARMLVLKKIDGIAKNKIVVKHFIREISVHKNLSHKNIIKYIDNGVESSFPYLIMEYANLSDLENLLEKSGGQIPFKECINYLIQSLEGLQCMHDNNIVHRDIKPGNILLHKHKNENIIKLTDFGLAKPYKNAAGTVLTKVGDKKGSIMYMSREQIQNAKDVDHRSDIYSLGVTFYYLLTTYMPFQFPSNFAKNHLLKKYHNKREKYLEELIKLGFRNNVINLVLSTEAIPIEKRVPGIDKNISTIINKMIQHDIHERYQTVADILKDLNKINA